MAFFIQDSETFKFALNYIYSLRYFKLILWCSWSSSSNLFMHAKCSFFNFFLCSYFFSFYSFNSFLLCFFSNLLSCNISLQFCTISSKSGSTFFILSISLNSIKSLFPFLFLFHSDILNTIASMAISSISLQNFLIFVICFSRIMIRLSSILFSYEIFN